MLGFAAGISPGPLLAMTISETLQHGSGEGIKVAVSPLVTDILIVSAIVSVLIKLKDQDIVIALISFSGAIYLLYLGVSSLRTKANNFDLRSGKKDSLKKGIVANFLSPHPYLFWIAIGGPILFQTLEIGITATVMFVGGFYAFLVGSKIIVALLVGKSRYFLKSEYYLNTIRALGIIYIVFAFVFIRQGIAFIM